jgi:hypothetical protein
MKRMRLCLGLRGCIYGHRSRQDVGLCYEDFGIAKHSLVRLETGQFGAFRHGSFAPETPQCRSFDYTRSHVIGRLAAWCARCGHGCRTKWTGILSLNPAFDAIYVINMITGQVPDPISFFQGYKANYATGSRVIFVVGGGLINLRRSVVYGMIRFGFQKKLAGRRTVSSRSCQCIVIPEIPYPMLLNQSLLQHSIDQHVICGRKAAIDTIGNGMTSLVGKT